MKIQNPHDKFFKETFSNVEVAKDFINNYLPSNIASIIDVNTLEPQKDSFINEDLEEVFSDMLFKAEINHKTGYVYFLFEHKSYSCKNVAFQLLRYMIEIWEAKIKKEKTYELPIIIPLVVYHGEKEWKVKTELGEMITGYDELSQDVKRYIPNYEYLIYDLSKYTDEEIKGEAQLRILLSIFRDIFTKDREKLIESIERAAHYLDELDDRKTGIEYFETFMKYIMNAGQKLKKTDIAEIIKKIENTYPEGSDIVMTLAEILRKEGIQEGIQEGKLIGLEEGKMLGLEAGKMLGLEEGSRQESLNVARRLIRMKMPIKQIVEVTKLSRKEIEKLINEVTS